MRRMLDPKEAGGSLPSTITFDGDGNRKVGKNLEVDGAIKLPSLNTTFTKGELPVQHASNSSHGELVYSSELSTYAAGAGNWLLSPLFYRKTPRGYAEYNPTFVYAYKSDKDNHQPTIGRVDMQGLIGVASITIKNADRSLNISYLNSYFRNDGYAVPQKGLVKDYASFTQNLNKNKNFFISVSGFTKSGAPLMLVYKDGKPYVRVVNTTTLEESDVLIPQDAAFTFSTTELLSQ